MQSNNPYLKSNNKQKNAGKLKAVKSATKKPAGTIPYGLVVRIRGFHPRGPGSIPGMGIPFAPPEAESQDLSKFPVFSRFLSNFALKE
uniref:COesterase domain-containing protein n=1 Tax=Strongyloides papillosus TaxID=174720 RepID=A0A0N5BM61_STREA